MGLFSREVQLSDMDAVALVNHFRPYLDMLDSIPVLMEERRVSEAKKLSRQVVDDLRSFIKGQKILDAPGTVFVNSIRSKVDDLDDGLSADSVRDMREVLLSSVTTLRQSRLTLKAGRLLDHASKDVKDAA